MSIATSTSTSPWQWSVTDLVQATTERRISAREAVDACLRRIDQVNPSLNALVEVHHDEALRAAGEADARAASGASLGPLHGVPVAIKVNTDQAGRATTGGIAALHDAVAVADAAVVRKLRSAGAVVVGRSNTPGFSFRWSTDNDLHGRTLNPWSGAHTAGGSSGGAASAVASGMVPLAQGNDIGGSVRYPAHACGVVGLRPTLGRASVTAASAADDMSLSVQLMAVHGPLARSVRDVRRALSVMGRPDPAEAVGLPAAQDAGPGGRRVAVVRSVDGRAPAPAVEVALDDATARLRDAGYVLEEVELPLLAEAHRLWFLLCLEDFRSLLPLVEQWGDRGLQRSVSHLYAVAEDWWGPQPALHEVLQGWARRGSLVRRLQEFLERHPLLLTPVSAQPAFLHGADAADLDQMRVLASSQWPMTCVPALGFPAVAVPTGVTDGLPAGVQLVGRRFGEDAMLTAAQAIEDRTLARTPPDWPV